MFDERNLGGATAQRLKPHAARASEQIEETRAANIVLQHGEECLAHAILRGAHIQPLGNGQHAPAKFSAGDSHSAASFFATIGATILGSALPFESFMTCPTKNPAAAFLPALKSATGPGLAAIA